MLTNRDVLMAMSDEVLANQIGCPNDFIEVGYRKLRDIPCMYRQTHDCQTCIAEWLSKSATIVEDDYEEDDGVPDDGGDDRYEQWKDDLYDRGERE